MIQISTAQLGQEFEDNGFIITPSADPDAIDFIQTATAKAAARALDMSEPQDSKTFLDRIHDHIKVDQLNALRLAVIEAVMADPGFLDVYFSCGRPYLEALVGNELAVQKNIALSVQLPGDKSSLLPLHSDAWGSECSPFEVVMWVPLVDCYQTKSMFFAPPQVDAKWCKRMHEYQDKGVEAFYQTVKDDMIWMDVPFGHVMFFSPSFMHGNRINETDETRWSYNIRFKGLFTPYSGKRLGEYFKPLTTSPATKIALKFEMPGGFDD